MKTKYEKMGNIIMPKRVLIIETKERAFDRMDYLIRSAEKEAYKKTGGK